MKSLLTIDTSANICSIGLFYNNKLFIRTEHGVKNHANVILSFINELLLEACISLAELDAIIFAKGPGSFTGLRISCCIAQGLAASQNIKVIGISTLQALAQQTHRKFGVENVWVINDARMNEVYHGQFKLNVRGGMEHYSSEKVEPLSAIEGFNQQWTFVGSGLDIANDEYPSNCILSNKVLLDNNCSEPEDLIFLAKYKLPATAEFALPCYIRNNVAHKKRETHG